VQQKLTLEIGQERFTRLDRTLLDEAHDGRVDLRISPHQSYLVRANRHLLISRLDRLPAASSTWRTAYAGRRTGSPRCCWRGRM
jgi:hypothetical protein